MLWRRGGASGNQSFDKSLEESRVDTEKAPWRVRVIFLSHKAKEKL